MLTLQKLTTSDHLRQVFDWNNGNDLGWNYDEWLQQNSQPNWLHYGVDRAGNLIGCISLEMVNPKTASIHLAFAPNSIRTAELRPLLVSIGISLFDYGIQQIEAASGLHNGAAAIAQACGMRMIREENGEPVYGMTIGDYHQNPVKWDNMQYQEVGH